MIHSECLWMKTMITAMRLKHILQNVLLRVINRAAFRPPPHADCLEASLATICCPRALISEGASTIKFSIVSKPSRSEAPIPRGTLFQMVTFMPTPGIAFFRRYEIQRCTTSGSASHALIARLCTLRSKFSCDFLWAKGLRMTVHKDRCVGRGITLDAGIPREEAA